MSRRRFSTWRWRATPRRRSSLSMAATSLPRRGKNGTARGPRKSPAATGVADRHPGADVLLDAILRERVAQPVLGQRLHAGDRLWQVIGRQGHQHLVVEHPAIATLGKARDREARIAR